MLVTVHILLDLASWAGNLAVALLVLLRPERNPLVWPVALLAINMFAWNFADFGYTISGRLHWHLIDLGLSPFSPTLALHLGARFVGQTPARRATLIFFYLWSAALAGVSWLAFVSPAARLWIAGETWSAAFLIFDVFALGTALVWLGRHASRVSDRDERRRTWTMMTAMLVGALLSTTDFWDDFGVPVPSLANIASLVSASLLAMASLRLGIFGRNLPVRVAVLASVLAAAGVVGYAGLFHWLSGNTVAVMVGTFGLTLVLLVAVRRLAGAYTERRDRTEALARQGRFSAQLAHDLKNPLAALKGAVQYLDEEVNRGGSLKDQREFLRLLVDQVDRVDHVVDGYAQLGRLQPRLAETSLNRVVREVLGLQAFVRRDIVIRPELDESLPSCSLDPDLVGRAVENLLRNSTEAMPGGGTVNVRTTTELVRGRVVGASIIVRDTGPGMNARQAAHAFDDFFTTKPEGTGLGLPFIKRVVQAHGGRVDLASKPGGGTSVTLYFPATRGDGDARQPTHTGR